MTYSVTEYAEQARALLPRGVLWESLKENETFNSLLTALCEEPARIDARVDNIFNELDPRTVNELLIEWEAWAGLPDSCIDSEQTLQIRRENLQAQLINDNGQSLQYFINLAESLGFIITITERSANKHGDTYGRPYGGTDWNFVWEANAPQTTLRANMYGQSGYGESYRTWGNKVLECLFNKYLHAHLKIIFTYGG